jgi:hypothetical protein
MSALDVVRSATTTTLTASAPAALLNDQVVFTAHVSNPTGAPTPTGTVAFTDSAGRTLCLAAPVSPSADGGTATCQQAFVDPVLELGSQTVTATYSGDAAHTDPSNDVNVRVRDVVPVNLILVGSQRVGDASPTIVPDEQTVDGVSATGSSAVCTQVTTATGPALVGPALPVGQYSFVPSSCSGGTLTGPDSGEHHFVLNYVGQLVVLPAAGALAYLGPTFASTGNAAVSSTSVSLRAQVTPPPGDAPDLTKVPVVFQLFASTNATTTPDSTCAASVSASGLATCNLTLSVDNWAVVVHLSDASLLDAADTAPALLTVSAPSPGATAVGRGQVNDTGTNVSTADPRGHLRFSVRFAQGISPAGQAEYRWVGADGNDYTVRSTGWHGGGLSITVGATTFGGTCTVTVTNPVTGRVVRGLGGAGFSYRTAAADAGDSGDSYAISIYTPGGALFHQAGTPTAQLPLRAGNIAVHTS